VGLVDDPVVTELITHCRPDLVVAELLRRHRSGPAAAGGTEGAQPAATWLSSWLSAS
jgi:hypothetical protein